VQQGGSEEREVAQKAKLKMWCKKQSFAVAWNEACTRSVAKGRVDIGYHSNAEKRHKLNRKGDRKTVRKENLRRPNLEMERRERKAGRFTRDGRRREPSQCSSGHGRKRNSWPRPGHKGCDHREHKRQKKGPRKNGGRERVSYTRYTQAINSPSRFKSAVRSTEKKRKQD